MINANFGGHQVVGDELKYTDYQATLSAIKTVQEHNPAVPLFMFISFQVKNQLLAGLSSRKCSAVRCVCAVASNCTAHTR